MDESRFERTLENELRALDGKQAAYFAWRCALRVLPFLGAKGNFDFWHEKSKQQHIYAILYALDVNAAATNLNFYVTKAAGEATNEVTNEASAIVAAKAVDEATNEALNNVTGTDVTAHTAVAHSTYTVAYIAAAHTAAAAAYTAADYAAAACSAAVAEYYVAAADNIADTDTHAAAEAASYVSLATGLASCVADYANTSASCAAGIFGNKNRDLKLLILQDLVAIKSQEKGLQPITTEWYGEVWNNFQQALAAEGCGYWGQLYENIFRDGAVLDLDALARRINVPKEIRTQGAGVVANHLREVEKVVQRD